MGVVGGGGWVCSAGLDAGRRGRGRDSSAWELLLLGAHLLLLRVVLTELPVASLISIDAAVTVLLHSLPFE